jgi:ABC-type transport system involved in multi-copper enzyme maturation permease subunit
VSLRRLLRLAAIEAGKMRRQRLAQLVVGGPGAVAALVPAGLHLSGREGMQGFLAMTTALELALLLGAFLILIQAALSIAGERSEKTLRDVLAAPVRRFEVLLARWLVLEMELVLLVALVAAAGLISADFFHDFEDITAGAIEPLFYASELREETVRAVLYHVPPAAALVTMGLLISVVAASPAVAAAAAAGSLLAIDIAKSIFSGASSGPLYLFNAYLPTLFDRTSYLHGVTALANGIGDVVWSEDSVRHALVVLVPLGTIAAFLGLALAVFSRTDFAD